jgi:hypothetical protein
MDNAFCAVFDKFTLPSFQYRTPNEIMNKRKPIKIPLMESTIREPHLFL